MQYAQVVSGFMFNTNRVLKEIEKRGAKRIYLQAPEGLKTRILTIAKELEKHGLEVFISCEPCFGACDIRDLEAKELGCDLLLHIGHTDFGVKPRIPVIYEPYEIDFNPLPLLKRHLPELEKYKTICLFTTSQFLRTIEPAKDFLERNGIKISLGKHTRSGEEGQVLGCDYSATLPSEKEADCFLYMGSGIFHPLGLALRTEKPVLSLDFETGKLENMTKEKTRLERIKAYHIEQAKEARNFGILLTVKPGQMLLETARILKKKLESKNKNAWILTMDQITPEKILGLDLDILVNCACPRMNEDFELFEKPILNPEDISKI